MWISPALVLLMAVYAGERARSLVQSRRADGADLLWIFAAISALLYIGLAAYWGKYLAPAALAGALGAGIWLARDVAKISIARPRGLAVMVALLGVIAVAAASPRVRVGPVEPTLDAALRDPRNLALVLQVAGMAALALAASRVIRAPTRALAAGVTLAGALAVTSVIDQSRVIFSTADNGPLRAGTEQGFDALMRRLNGLEEAPAILAPKEIGYYYRGRSYPLETIATRGREAILEVAHRPDVRIVIDTREWPAIAGQDPVPGADLEEIGTFRLFVKR
jgi:hypothetical protein